MKIVNFLGGLGNQMFIYALCEHLRTTFPDEKIRGCYRSGSLNIHHGLEIAKVFDVELPPATHLSDAISMMYAACKRMGLTRWENDRHFGRWDVVLDGYWLDRFFYRDKDVKKMFRFRDTHMTGTNRRIEQMMETTEAVALHVRRGDYRSKENMELFGKFCDMEYYNKAIETMRKKVGEPRFFIFSDDPAWCKENIVAGNAVYVDANSGDDSWKDMFLMSRCRHLIIANSTFSYWAAMLRENDGTVMYPRKWYRWDNPDIFPEEWIAV